MVFYKIEVRVEDSVDACDKNFIKELKTVAMESSDLFFSNCNKEEFIFVSSTKENTITLGLICKKRRSLDIITEFLNEIKIMPKTVDIEESTLKAVSHLLTTADRACFVSDDFDILESFGINDLSDNYGRFEFGESFLDEKLNKHDISNLSKELLISDTLLPEINRIYKGQARVKIEGHPVHYMVIENDKERRKTTTRAILSALYSNNRIKNKRYCYINFDKSTKSELSNYEALYESSHGGAIILRYENEDLCGDEASSRGVEALNDFCQVAYKYRNKVLTIFCLPTDCEIVKEQIALNFKTISLIEIKNDLIDVTKANKYLRLLCKNNAIKVDRSLLYGDNHREQFFSVKELDKHFDAWYDNKLRKSSYPQYNMVSTSNEEIIESKPKGKAYTRLQELIGLSDAKAMIDSAISYFKAQRLFEERGITVTRPNMHMVFTGNPGTAKTTVARLFAQIMRDNGILENGELYEVGRADLVGKYVGHTAPMVKKSFEKAKGGVLFIDEAYSLVDDKDGLYGDEAINTIVQEMENNRQNTIVIFAGYPDKMEDFLKKNPGLRSRIAFHIDFSDYSAKELCDISKLVATDIGLTLSEGAIDKLGLLFERVRKNCDFGNGRFARNIIEKAKMAQAKRIMSQDYSKLSNTDICTIIAEDIEDDKKSDTIKRAIGFVS